MIYAAEPTTRQLTLPMVPRRACTASIKGKFGYQHCLQLTICSDMVAAKSAKYIQLHWNVVKSQELDTCPPEGTDTLFVANQLSVPMIRTLRALLRTPTVVQLPSPSPYGD